MNLAGWLLLGAILGTFQTYSQVWTVNSLNIETPIANAFHVFIGTALRWWLAAFLLILALQEGILPGLLAFAGLILARWLVLITQNRS